MPLHAVFSDQAPKPIGPYSQAIESAAFVFISGQLPLDPATGALSGASTRDQARQSLRNLLAVLRAAGLGASNLVKTTVFLRSMGDFGEFNEVYEEALGPSKPARSVVEVSALPRGALVEIEAVACR